MRASSDLEREGRSKESERAGGDVLTREREGRPAGCWMSFGLLQLNERRRGVSTRLRFLHAFFTLSALCNFYRNLARGALS